MDLAYLRAHPGQLPTFLRHQRVRETPVAGGSICAASRLTFDSGESIFTKSLRQAPPGFFAAEANGLRWLREAGSVPVPEVLVELPDLLALEWVEPVEPTAAAAERFGRDLADLHRAGAAEFGAGWPGYLGSLPLDNTPTQGPWPAWFARRRLLPYLEASTRTGALAGADAHLVHAAVEAVAGYAGPGADEPPARLHGDLWPGNLIWAARGPAAGAGGGPPGGDATVGPPGGGASWTADQPGGRVWLVDPAAHGGHRETDLALLGLFGGVPHEDRIRRAYHEVWPLAEGWAERVAMHQLYLLLAHTALNGCGYRGPVCRAAGAVLAYLG